jgi:hypothetical protein
MLDGRNLARDPAPAAACAAGSAVQWCAENIPAGNMLADPAAQQAEMAAQ